MQENFDERIEKALHSIDGVQKAAPAEFFFTRLEARMKKNKSAWESVTSFVASPAIAFGCILLVIAINAIVIFSSSVSKNAIVKQNNELAAVDEYSEVTTTLYDFENIKP